MPKPPAPPTPSGETYGEGVREFSRTHDTDALARDAEADLPPEAEDTEDDETPQGSGRAEEEPEW